MKVRDLWQGETPRLVTAWPQQRLGAAAKAMADGNVGAMPVLDDGRLVGMFSERDVSRAVAAHGAEVTDLRVEDVMTREVVSCRPEDSLSVAMESMDHAHVRHLPALDAAGRLLGVISQRDVLTALLTATRQEADAQREQALLDRLHGMRSGPRE